MTDTAAKSANWKPIVVLLGAGIVCGLVLMRSPLINGSWYWRWHWRDTSNLPGTRFFLAMLLAAIPMIAAWMIQNRKLQIALLCVSVIAMKLISLAVLTSPMTFDAMEQIVRSPDATSYYSDAEAIRTDPIWLADYPKILELPQINLHTKSKPPGAVAYYMMWIHALGDGARSAIAGGIGIAILAALSIPAIYWFISLLTPNRNAASVGAVLLTLCPGFILIFPTLDSCYPALACVMLGTWHLALTRNDWRFAITLAIVLSVTCFMTYNLLVLGAIMVAWPFVLPGDRMIGRAMRLAIIALLAFVFLNAVFFVFTGFNPIATFQTAYHNQQMLLAQHRAERPYPWTILFDLLDFGFGAGWVIVLLVIFAIVHRLLRSQSRRDLQSKLIILFLAQPILVAILGILQSETARAWNFMLPLLIFPAALELSRWLRVARITTYVAMLIVLLVIGYNMIFMAP